MEFRGMESVVVELLRTPELQRLRRVRQLGLGHLVFPGAEHSRLSHSLGAAFVGIRFARQLQERARDVFISALTPDDATVRDVAVGALCHDLGHGPLSHAWEREIVHHEFDRLKWCVSLELPADDERLLKLKWHELVGHGLLAWPDGQLHRLLEQHEEGSVARIRELLLGSYYIPYLPRLLSSDIDVDRSDFIRRDTHQTGVAYGRYDLDWLISTCGVGRLSRSDGQWVIGFDERKATRVVEQFLIARRAMYDTVYYHKTVRCAEGMVALFLRRLRQVIQEQGLPTLEALDFLRPMVRIIQGDAVAPHELLRLDDFALSVLIENIAQSNIRDVTARDLARRISARDLFKIVHVTTEQIEKYFRSGHTLERLHEAIKPYCPGDPAYYFIMDETEFEMMSEEDAQKVCLLRNDGTAMFATQHPAFASFQIKTALVRMFTLREAVPAVEAVISRPPPLG
jgi:HD superfamily phosphohydrolase